MKAIKAIKKIRWIRRTIIFSIIGLMLLGVALTSTGCGKKESQNNEIVDPMETYWKVTWDVRKNAFLPNNFKSIWTKEVKKNFPDNRKFSPIALIATREKDSGTDYSVLCAEDIPGDPKLAVITVTKPKEGNANINIEALDIQNCSYESGIPSDPEITNGWKIVNEFKKGYFPLKARAAFESTIEKFTEKYKTMKPIALIAEDAMNDGYCVLAYIEKENSNLPQFELLYCMNQSQDKEKDYKLINTYYINPAAFFATPVNLISE